jgi:hypothetical protein
MYTLLLYIQLTDKPEQVSFSNPFQGALTDSGLDIRRYDFDSHSDPIVLSYAEKLWQESALSIIYIDAFSKENLGKCRSFLNKLIENSEKSYLVVKGENPVLERMISVFPQSQILKNTYKMDEIEAIIKQLSGK